MTTVPTSTHLPMSPDPQKQEMLDCIMALHVMDMKRLDEERHVLLVHIKKHTKHESAYLLKLAALNRNYKRLREAQSREFAVRVNAVMKQQPPPQE